MKCCALLVAAFFVASCTASTEDAIVEIENGKIRGSFDGLAYSFESIPYAKAPVGELRLEAPQALDEKWSEVRNATTPPVVCLQLDPEAETEDKLRGEEDCLLVNVYTPEIAPREALFPVVVFIHGGGFMYGSAEWSHFDRLMKQRDLVVVKISYRLGPLGFLSTADEQIAGNFGLKDQLLALKWVQRNIKAFNGDPAKVLLTGFSAGGASAHLHYLNKKESGLMHSVIAWSGNAFCPWVITPKPEKTALELARHLGCEVASTKDAKECLKTKSSEDIVRATPHFQPFLNNPFTVYGPVIESKSVKDAFITENPEDIIKSGNSFDLPILFSYAKEDGGYNAALLARKQPNGREYIEVLNEKWADYAPYILFYHNSLSKEEALAYSSKLRKKYLKDAEFSMDTYRQVQQIYTDLSFASGAEKSVRLHKEFSKGPVYAYLYDNAAPVGLGQGMANRTDVQFGTVHGDDMYLIANVSIRVDVPLRPDEAAISANFVNLIRSAATTGDWAFGEQELQPNVKETDELKLLVITGNNYETKSVKSFV